MQLIVISDSEIIPDEASIINELFDNGLHYFHLRKPAYTIDKVEKLLLQIKPEYYSKIALHQFHQQAEDFGMKRLHYTEKTRQLSNIHQWQLQKDKGYILSASVHDVASLLQIPACFEYVFFGPVFNSISKKGYESILPEGFCLQTTEKPVPVIALGGIIANRIEKVKKMNFDGVAVLGTIWNKPQKALDEFKKLQQNVS